MLLVTSKPKQISIPFRQTGYETKDSLSKVLIKPVRDSSIEAAQRSKSASLQRITNINKKIQKLQIFKQKLVSEKLKFAKYEKYKNFLDIVDNIIEERWKIEEKSAILIQSTYKGYICRKKYLENMIKLERERTNRLLHDMEKQSTQIFYNLIGTKAAIVMQKYFRMFKAKRHFKSCLNAVKNKIRQENLLITAIQIKFKAFLAQEHVSQKKFEKEKEEKLEKLRLNQKARIVYRFLRKCLNIFRKEKEDLRMSSLLPRYRRKAIRNNNIISNKPRTSLLSVISQSHSPALDPDVSTSIPNIFGIYRIITNKNRPLSSAEKSQQQTESSCIRRRSVMVKRFYPPVSTSCSLKLDDEKLSKVSKDRYSHVYSNYLHDTESSYNRINCEPQPPTPDFIRNKEFTKKKIFKLRKQPTIITKSQKMGSVIKSTIFSTHGSRSTTPNVGTRPRTVNAKY